MTFDTDDGPDDRSEASVPSRRQLIGSLGALLVPGSAGVRTAVGATGTTNQHIPNDPKFGEQYVPQMVRAPAAWADQRTGGPQSPETTTDVTVGILDAGVDYTHPDLSDRFGANNGKDFLDSDADPKPDPGRWYIGGATLEVHGTHVAGIIGATKGNETEISGIAAPRLLSARVAAGIDLTSEDGSVMGGEIDLQNALDGAQYLVDQGADVINVSMATDENREELYEFVDYALKNDVLVVAAAGNRRQSEVGYPAQYPDVLGVSAVGKPPALASGTHSDEFWQREPTEWNLDLWQDGDRGSNYGSGVDVCAPGEAVLSLYPDRWYHNRYGNGSGTSMAAPVVSGVAALIRSKNPALTAWEVREIITSSARDCGLSEQKQGAGLVDAASAVEMVDRA